MVLKYLNAGSEPTIPAMLPVPNATLPYWRTELHKIDEHRSTKNLPEECDIAIIGSGMAGVGTAYHISQLLGEDDSKKDRPSIVLLEAREVCSGATGRNGVGTSLHLLFLLSLVMARSLPFSHSCGRKQPLIEHASYRATARSRRTPCTISSSATASRPPSKS